MKSGIVASLLIFLFAIFMVVDHLLTGYGFSVGKFLLIAVCLIGIWKTRKVGELNDDGRME